MTHSLLFDDTLELCDRDGLASGESYWFESLAAGTSFGKPQPIEVAIGSLLRDGAIVAKTGDDNCEVTLLVKVRATDGAALDEGVAALARATGKRTTLVWTPPDGYGEPRAWDVETSNLMEPNGFDDLALKRNEQTYQLRLVCLPFRRSLAKVIDDAGTPPASGGVLLYNCESTTGWSKWSTWSGGGGPVGTDITVDSAVFVEGSASIRAHSQYGNINADNSYYFQSSDKVEGLSLDTGTGGYLSIKIRTTFSDRPTDGLVQLWMTTAERGESQTDNFLTIGRDEDGWVRYMWLVDAGLTITGLRFLVRQTSAAGSGSTPPYVNYDDVELSTAATTDHQIVKTHNVLGSARTTASLRIASPSESIALGHVLAITVPTSEVPAGFQPDGARWVTQGTTTADSSALGGSYYTPSTTTYDSGTGKPIFDVPAGMLTAGPYTMVALVKAEGSPTVAGVKAQLLVGGSLVGPTSTAEVSLPNLAAGWQFVTLGTCYLPPLPVQQADTSTKVRLLIKGAKLANVYMIPAWEVGGRPVADFSIVDCGSGTVGPGAASSSLWIDSPSTSQPQGGWWRGPTADRANAQSAWPDAKKPGVHTFPPGSLTNFVVSTGAAGPTSTLEYYPAWL